MSLRPAAAVLALTLFTAHVLAADAKPAAPAKAAEKPPAAATASITGKVAGPDGKPVANAVVRAIPMPSRTTSVSLRGGGPPDVPKAVVAKTDDKGAFKI